jgi:hypothetical protein
MRKLLTFLIAVTAMKRFLYGLILLALAASPANSGSMMLMGTGSAGPGAPPICTGGTRSGSGGNTIITFSGHGSYTRSQSPPRYFSEQAAAGHQQAAAVRVASV